MRLVTTHISSYVIMYILYTYKAAVVTEKLVLHSAVRCRYVELMIRLTLSSNK